MNFFHKVTCLLVLLFILAHPAGLLADNDHTNHGREREDDIRSIKSMMSAFKSDSITEEEKFLLAYKTLKLSIEQSFTEGKAEAYLQIGNYFVHKRKHVNAIRFLLSATQLFSDLKDTTGLMKVDHAIFAIEIYLKAFDNAEKTARHGLELARQSKDLLNTGFFLERMADVFHEQNDTSRSLDYYMESLKYYNEAGAKKNILEVYMSVGGIYLDQKRYDEVLVMYDTLAPLADSIDPATAGTMYTRIAHVYDQRKNYKKALVYNKKALLFRRKARTGDAENSSIINIAGDFYMLNMPDSGGYYIDIGLRDAKANNRVFYLRNGYNVLYNYYLSKGDDKKALEFFKLKLAVNDSILKERLNTNISVIRSGQNIRILREGIKQLERQNSLQKLFIRNQKIFKILLTAIALAVIIAVFIILRINLRHRRSKRDIETLNIKLQHEAAERKLIQKKTTEKEDQYRFIAEHSLDLITRIDKNHIFTYASSASVDVLGYEPGQMVGMNLFDIAIPGYIDFLKEKLNQAISTRRPHSIAFLAKKKANEPVWVEITLNPVFDSKNGEFREFVSVTRNIQELKKREMGIVEGTKQKENLLREIHHRVKNNFAILVSLINMQKSQTQSEDVKQSLTNLQLRIRTMALVHEMLYRSEDFEKISFPDYVRSVASVISSTYGRMNVNLDFKLDPFIINIETAIPLGLILNELLSNAYRHAFDENAGGAITISFCKDPSPSLFALTISDTGKGMPDGFIMEGSKTMGLQIVDLLVKQIEGRMIIKQGGGTSFSIVFPIEG
ncbi:MAG: histidine kinase dimerization/phosphoacceptor domain -containing protein [Bacteroidota bacterium]